MNLFRGIYCRTFQLGLKIALPFLPYRTPRVVGSVKALPGVIRKKKCRRPLIITDPGIRKLGLLRGLEKALREAGLSYRIYEPSPTPPRTTWLRRHIFIGRRAATA